MKIEEFQRLGKNVKVIIRKFTENPGKFASVVLQMYWDIEKERDSYKQQRDELINDMAEVKRKAEAWDKQKDELREMVVFGCNLEENTPSKYMNEAYKIVFKKMCELDCTNDFQNLLSDLERGSDE